MEGPQIVTSSEDCASLPQALEAARTELADYLFPDYDTLAAMAEALTEVTDLTERLAVTDCFQSWLNE